MIIRILIDAQEKYAAQLVAVSVLGAGIFLFVSQFYGGLQEWILERQIVPFIILFLLLDTLTLLTRIMSQHTAASSIRISRDQANDDAECMRLIREQRPQEADLLEFSSTTADPIIQALKSVGSRVRILVKHPKCVGPPQQMRIVARVRHLLVMTFEDYPGAEIRCYRAAASLRGRRFGQVVNLSWYTPDLKQKEFEVRGHSNPLVTASVDTDEGKHLARMFNTVFELLWDDEETVTARQALKEMNGEALI